MSAYPFGVSGRVAPWRETAERVCRHLTERALARCNELGIDWGDFYAAMLADAKEYPANAKTRPLGSAGVEERFERIFRRLGADPGDALRHPGLPPGYRRPYRAGPE